MKLCRDNKGRRTFFFFQLKNTSTKLNSYNLVMDKFKWDTILVSSLWPIAQIWTTEPLDVAHGAMDLMAFRGESLSLHKTEVRCLGSRRMGALLMPCHSSAPQTLMEGGFWLAQLNSREKQWQRLSPNACLPATRNLGRVIIAPFSLPPIKCYWPLAYHKISNDQRSNELEKTSQKSGRTKNLKF